MPRTARKWLTAITVVVGGGLLIAAAPAHAVEAALPVAAHVSGVKAVPGVLGSKGRICLENSSSYCLESNGAGHQVTITNHKSDYSVFTVVDLIHGNGYSEYQWQNASGNCLRIGTGYTVALKDGNCSDTDNADWWGFRQNYVNSEYYGSDYMLVRGPAGQRVQGLRLSHDGVGRLRQVERARVTP